MATPSGVEPDKLPLMPPNNVIPLRSNQPNAISSDWDTEASDGRYSLWNFYTAASDSKGHGEVISFKVPPHMKGRIANLVDAIPNYKNQSDFVRDACRHREQWLTDNMAECRLTEEAMMMRAVEETEQAQAMIENLANFVLKAEITAQRYLKERDRLGFEPWAEKIEEAARAVRQPYCERALRVIRKVRDRFNMLEIKKGEMKKGKGK